MSEWNNVAHFMFGQGDIPQWNGEPGFWYADPLKDINELTEEQLFWVPDPNSLCTLFHVGHIAHRERVHLAVLLQRQNEEDAIPSEFGVLGVEWCSSETLKQSVASPDSVLEWVRDVRNKSHEYIASLSADDFHKVPPTSPGGLSVAHFLFITSAHTAFHIGCIRHLRALMQGHREGPC